MGALSEPSLAVRFVPMRLRREPTQSQLFSALKRSATRFRAASQMLLETAALLCKGMSLSRESLLGEGLVSSGRAVQTSSPRHHGLCGPSLALQACCCCSWLGALWPAGGREIRDLAQQVSRRYEQSISRRWPSIVVTLGVGYGLICLAILHVHLEAARVLPWYFAPRPLLRAFFLTLVFVGTILQFDV